MAVAQHPIPPRPPAEQPLLIDVQQLTQLLGRSRASIARDVAAGRVPDPVRIGNSTRWRLGEIRAWVAAGCPPRSL